MLLTLLLLPLLASLLTYLMSNRAGRWFTLVVCIADLGLVWASLRLGAPEIHLPWMPSLGIAIQLKLTGQNLLMLFLGPLLVGCATLSTSGRQERLAEYCGHLLLLLGALQGVFLANNLGLFYICFELMLLPTLLLVSRWGGEEGRQAAVKFLLYTLAGSLPMMLAVVALAMVSVSPDLSFDALSNLSLDSQMGLFGLFFLAFAVKIPLFPLHGWVVDLYESSPAPVTAVVAGAMSKAGLYGLLRICVGLLPEATRVYSDNLAWLAFFSLIYGGACALGAPRARSILAYASLSHLALMAMGILAFDVAGRDGALLQMFSHGLCIGGLFLVVGMLEQRGVPLELAQMGGLHRALPRLTAVALVFTMAGLGCPGLSTFPGELCLLLGIFQASPLRGVLACVSVVLSAWYMLRFFQGALQGPGPEGSGRVSLPRDLAGAEPWAVTPLIVLIFAMGFAPLHFLLWVRWLPWT